MTAAASTGSSLIDLRTRGDLVWVPQTDAYGVPNGHTIIMDPIANRMVIVNEFEAYLLERLGGWADKQRPFDQSTLPAWGVAGLCTEIEKRFPPRQVKPRQLQRILGHFHRLGVLVSNHPRQADEAISRVDRQRNWKLLGQANPLMLRLPGVNPNALLQLSRPVIQAIVRPATALLWMLFAAFVFVLVISSHHRLQEDLPSLDSMLSWQVAPMLLVSLSVAKVVHELGHAIACTRQGVPCNEIGFGLFFLAPCLYTDASHAWLLPSRIQRTWVTLGGVIAEFVFASVVGLLWWLAEPGIARQQLFYLLTTCTVLSALINLNPLLRYDGYYLLSDYLQIPNLFNRSRRRLAKAIRSVLLGARDNKRIRRDHQWFLLGYAVISIAYRAIVITAALIFVFMLFDEKGAPGLGLVGCFLTVTLMSLPTARQTWQWIRNPAKRYPSPPRALVLLGLTSVLVCCVATVPMPNYVNTQGLLRPASETTVFATVPGQIESINAREGMSVKRGEILLSLHNNDLSLELTRLRQKSELLELKTTHLNRTRSNRGADAARLQSVAAQRDEAKQRLETLHNEILQLDLTAPHAGRVYAIPEQSHSVHDASTLASWNRDPLCKESQHAWIETGTSICRIGDANVGLVKCEVGESEVAEIERGQAASVLLGSIGFRFPNQTSDDQHAMNEGILSGHVVQIAAKIRHETEPIPNGQAPSALFSVVIQLDRPVEPEFEGRLADVRIRSKDRNLWQRLSRTVASVF